MRQALLCLLAGLAVLPRPVWAACPSLVAMMGHAEQSILEGRLDDYPALSEQMDRAFACGPVATPQQVARALLVQGVYQHFTGSKQGAQLSFASALRLDPQGWNPNYGDEVEALYRASAAEVNPGVGHLSVLPAPDPSLVVVIDGSSSTLPAKVEVGFHVVQVTKPDGSSLVAERVPVLDAGEQVVLNFGLLPPFAAAGESSAETRRRKPLWPLFAAGGAAALSGGAAVWAQAQDDRLRSAASLDALDEAYGTQRALAATAWTLGGLAAAGVGVWVAW